MSMTSHLKQKGLVPHQECSIPTSLDPILPFRLLRIISEMLHHYWKDLLINCHFMTLKFHNGLLTRIGIIFSPIWMKLMRIQKKNFMPMQLWKVKNSSVGLGEKVFQSLLHSWQRYFTLIGQCLKTHQFVMIYVQMRNCLRMVLDKTWNSHVMEIQLVFPLSLIN